MPAEQEQEMTDYGLTGHNDDLVADSKVQAREYELQCLRIQNDALQKEAVRLRQLLQGVALAQAGRVEKRSNTIHPSAHTVEDRGKVLMRPMGRCASMATQEALRKVTQETPAGPAEALAASVINACKNPLGSVEYLSSHAFAADVLTLCQHVRAQFETETRCLFMQSPVYVFGDIHGNLEDLRFFSDNVWTLGLPLTAGKFLFLGDYVDRGMHSVEVVAYMFALKLQCPDKVFMLRGNHELRDVNGWEDHYGQKSFLWQAKARFGLEMGMQVWEEVNQVFDRLPLAAVIDNDIFCVHGGIPRPVPGSSGNRVEDILMVPPVSGVSPYYAHESEETVRVASECLWSDPAKPAVEGNLDADGYGCSPRGAGAVCFGSKAVDQFLAQHGYSYIVRAHEAHSEGVALSKGARVFTVFSTSKDHNQGRGAMAGCILVDNDEIRIINRSPKYKNRVIRRRSSAVHMGLPQHWAEQGRRLGLIVDTASSNDLLKRGSWQRRANAAAAAAALPPAHGGSGGGSAHEGKPPSPAAAAASAGLKLFSGLFGGGSGGTSQQHAQAAAALTATVTAAASSGVITGGGGGSCSGGSTMMRGLNSREEDTERKLVDVFVESCDLDYGHSSSEEDEPAPRVVSSSGGGGGGGARRRAKSNAKRGGAKRHDHAFPVAESGVAGGFCAPPAMYAGSGGAAAAAAAGPLVPACVSMEM